MEFSSTKTCFFKHCDSSTFSTDIAFHFIPAKLAHLYLYQSGWYLDFELHNFCNIGFTRFKICSLHFDQQDFVYTVKKGCSLAKHIRHGVVPQQFSGQKDMSTQTDEITANSMSTQTVLDMCTADTQTDSVKVRLKNHAYYAITPA